jgi:hypothetical protein
MPGVADCLRQHGGAYLKEHGDAVPLGHRKVLSAITRCRTGELGGVLYRCDCCGREHWVGRSCSNRHCPTCGIDKTATWLEKQTAKLLPVQHFLITFTVPWELRMVVRANQRVCYDAMFNSSSQTICELASNPKRLGTAKIGFFGVLQTWGRDLTVYHPHIHFIVAGGGVSEDGSRWLSSAAGFFFPEACASPIFRAKMRDAFEAAGLKDQVDADIWAHDKWWEVDVKAVGDGRAVLKYLAPYVYRVAISDKRIEACDAAGVTFRYTPSKSKVSKTRTVTGNQFVGGFLQHVLPSGLKKIRYYGWMHSACRIDVDAVRWLVWLFLGWTFWLASGHAPQEQPIERPGVRCAECGGPMRIVEIVNVNCRALVEHSLDYLDSG